VSGPLAGGHICLVVDSDFDTLAADFLSEGNDCSEKTVAFGPAGSPLLETLRPVAAMTADPFVDVLRRRRLEPDAMFAMFRSQARQAAREGFRRLRVAADMDWLLPAARRLEDAVRFELLLDPVVAEIDATVLCAYRRRSFDDDLVQAISSAHPTVAGDHEAPRFRLASDATGCWSLAGELDLANATVLQSMLNSIGSHEWTLDVSELGFADVAGMRAIATAGAGRLTLRGASPSLRRHWALAGFDTVAHAIRFVD